MKETEHMCLGKNLINQSITFIPTRNIYYIYIYIPNVKTKQRSDQRANRVYNYGKYTAKPAFKGTHLYNKSLSKKDSVIFSI